MIPYCFKEIKEKFWLQITSISINAENIICLCNFIKNYQISKERSSIIIFLNLCLFIYTEDLVYDPNWYNQEKTLALLEIFQNIPEELKELKTFYSGMVSMLIYEFNTDGLIITTEIISYLLRISRDFVDYYDSYRLVATKITKIIELYREQEYTVKMQN